MIEEWARTLWKNRLARFGVVAVAALVAVAAFGPLVLPFDAQACRLEDELSAPSGAFWLGADPEGCDLLRRLVLGSRISLIVGVSVVSICAGVGVAVGLLAGLRGGRWDRAFLFVSECFQAFPGILLAIAISAVFPKRSLGLLILALSISGWVGYARVVRAQVLLVRELDYVTAARALGAGPLRIAVREVLPNVLSPVLVQATFGMAAAILAEAGMSFLGLGVPPGTPSWGAMLNEGRQYMLVAPHLSLWPGVAIMVVVLGFNFLGDGLRDAFDPRRRGR